MDKAMLKRIKEAADLLKDAAKYYGKGRQDVAVELFKQAERLQAGFVEQAAKEIPGPTGD